MATSQKDDRGLSFLKDSLVRNACLVAAALFLAFFIARAPTSYTGGLPIIGDKVPVKLNVVYIMVLAPVAAMLAAGTLWFEASACAERRRSRNGRGAVVPLAFALVLIGLLTVLLSLQYFLVLAPAEMCSSRPHYEFLWTNLQGVQHITHCMSGTAEINESSPYYIEPQLVQAWGYVVRSILTLVFLAKTWRASGK